MNLFEIEAEYKRALLELEVFLTESETDEIPDEINERLSINQDELNDKLKAYYYKIQSLESDKDLLKSEAKKLTDKTKNIDKTIDRLKSYIANALETFGDDVKNGKTYKTPLMKVTSKKSSWLVVDNLDLIPSDYKVVVPESYKADGAAIKKAIVNGEEIKGAYIDDTVNLITFK